MDGQSKRVSGDSFNIIDYPSGMSCKYVARYIYEMDQLDFPQIHMSKVLIGRLMREHFYLKCKK